MSKEVRAKEREREEEWGEGRNTNPDLQTWCLW